MNGCRFGVVDHGDTGWGDSVAFPCRWTEDDPTWLAEEAAEHFFLHCGGYSYVWPLVFRLWNADGVRIGDYAVELYPTPSFTAGEVHGGCLGDTTQ